MPWALILVIVLSGCVLEVEPSNVVYDIVITTKTGKVEKYRLPMERFTEPGGKIGYAEVRLIDRDIRFSHPRKFSKVRVPIPGVSE